MCGDVTVNMQGHITLYFERKGKLSYSYCNDNERDFFTVGDMSLREVKLGACYFQGSY